MRGEDAGLLSVRLRAVETKLVAKLCDLIGELVERSERILDLGVCKTRVGEVVYKLLVLLFKLRQRFFCGLCIGSSTVIEPVELVYGFVYGVL